MAEQPTDAELVNQFLAAVEGLSGDQASKQAKGITQDDVSRWRRGDWKRVTERKRHALQSYLQKLSNRFVHIRGDHQIHSRIREPEPERYAVSDPTGIVASPAALYATLTALGGPGEELNDKASIVELLMRHAAKMEREGKRFPIPMAELREIHEKILRGEV